MRLVYVAAARGMAIAVLLVTPVMLMGTSSAHADSGIEGYARCIGGGAQPPPPGVTPETWFPSVHVIQTDSDSGVPAAEIVQRLVGMGVSQKDAVTRVQCFYAYEPR
jgi:hypothetical protein